MTIASDSKPRSEPSPDSGFDTNYEAIFNDSFSRNYNNPALYDAFYQRFVVKSPELKHMFAHTDLGKLKKMLKTSLMYMIHFAATKAANDHLYKICMQHSTLNVKREYFEFWLQSLTEALEEVDPSYTLDQGLAWRIMLAPGIEFMKNFEAYS